MSDRVAAMMAEIEAKQREVERIIAEETKKNIVPPLIEVLEDCINHQDEILHMSSVSKDLAVAFEEAKAAYYDAVGGHQGEGALMTAAQNRASREGYHLTPEQRDAAMRAAAAAPNLDDYTYVFREHGQRKYNEVLPLRVKWLEASVFSKCIGAELRELSNLLCESTKKSIKAHLVAAKKDAEWKIQSFKIIDALTQRVAALEARLDAKETVPLGTPVLGSDPDSGEDSVEDTYEGSSSHESTRRTLFPYW